MTLFILRMIGVIAYCVPVVYTVYCLKKNLRPLYFKCVFYGLLGGLLASIFYLAISTDLYWDQIFSLGVFGEIACYLFLAVANIRYIPKEYEEQGRHFSVPGFLAALFFVAIYGVATYFDHSVGYIVTNTLYAASVGLLAYTSMDVIVNKYNNPFKEGVKKFNVLFLIQLVPSCLLQIGFAQGNEDFVLIVWIIALVVGVIALPLGIFFLKKGLEPWEI